MIDDWKDAIAHLEKWKTAQPDDGSTLNLSAIEDAILWCQTCQGKTVPNSAVAIDDAVVIELFDTVMLTFHGESKVTSTILVNGKVAYKSKEHQ